MLIDHIYPVFVISHSCGIPIKDADGNDQLIVTAGYATSLVSLYNLNGWVKDLQSLPETVGLSPGCASFISNGRTVRQAPNLH